MSAPRAVVVTPYAPSTDRSGSHHRTYQLCHDARSCLGESNVVVLAKETWSSAARERPQERHTFVQRVKRSLAYRSSRLAENPLRLVASTHFTAREWLPPDFVASYERAVTSSSGAVVCLLEHALFGALLEVNNRLGIPTLFCSHNLEAFAQNAAALSTIEDGSGAPWGAWAAAVDLVAELGVISSCEERLLISTAEAAMVSGLGWPARYYPYVPRGEIRDRHMELRRRRQETEQEPGLFLLLGNARYVPTRRSFHWFLQEAGGQGLPPGVRVVAAGLDTDTLDGAAGRFHGVELLGWASRQTLDDLLCRASAVLVPQRAGFGALTRLPEVSCAGIPVITTPYPAYTMDPPPGVRVADWTWEAWYDAMRDTSASHLAATEDEYAAWEARQERTLRTVLQRYL